MQSDDTPPRTRHDLTFGKNDRRPSWHSFWQRVSLVGLLSLLFLSTQANAETEPMDGVGNNVANPTWGSAGTDLLRLAPVGYADGIASPSLPNNLSARAISNYLNNQADAALPADDMQTVDQNCVSDFGYAFGQFMDHDLDNTPDGGASFPIAVAAADPLGPEPLPFTRSITDPATGTSPSNPAQQITVVTSYLDLSQVYGSSQTVATALRTRAGGLLKSSPGNMLPYDNTTYFTADQIAALNMANDAGAVPTNQLFATGDRRGNENIELTALQTLFMRNHNLIATRLLQQHPEWTDDETYQRARRLNIAVYQNIIYSEWIPAVLGRNALPAYSGYRADVNATIATEFSTVAYRFGHSLVSPGIERDDNDGQAITANIPLAFDFFDPNLLNPNGVVDPLTGLVSTDIDPILKGDASGDGQEMDLMAISAIRNLLFGNGGLGGQDLIALDVQRGRDNGIPDYNAVRTALGLPAVSSFAQVVGAPVSDQLTDSVLTVEQELAEAYPGGVGTIDAFEGGLAENHLPDSEVGPTFQAIMVNQFRRLRDGDRFFYRNENFNFEETGLLEGESTLAKVIMANTSLTNLQPAVIQFRASISGAVTGLAGGNPGNPGAQHPPNGNVGLAGITLELEDTSGDIIGTTETDEHGQYSFNQLSGPVLNRAYTPGVSATGYYEIVLVVPGGREQIGANPPPIAITRGDTHINGVNFTLTPAGDPPAGGKRHGRH